MTLRVFAMSGDGVFAHESVSALILAWFLQTTPCRCDAACLCNVRRHGFVKWLSFAMTPRVFVISSEQTTEIYSLKAKKISRRER